MSTYKVTKKDTDALLVALAAGRRYAEALPQAPKPTQEGTLGIIAASQRIHDSQPEGKVRARSTWILNSVKFADPIRRAAAASDDPVALAEEILRHALTEAGADA